MVGVKVKFACDSSWLSESNYELKDQASLYDRVLADIIKNPSWYIENFQKLREFRVSWVDYKKVNIYEVGIWMVIMLMIVLVIFYGIAIALGFYNGLPPTMIGGNVYSTLICAGIAFVAYIVLLVKDKDKK